MLDGYCTRHKLYTYEIVCEEDLNEDIYDTFATIDYVFCKEMGCEECGCFADDDEKEEVE